jgi:hypothetical protein
MKNRAAFCFVLIIGIANSFADFTYEGARGIIGPFLGSLGGVVFWGIGMSAQGSLFRHRNEALRSACLVLATGLHGFSGARQWDCSTSNRFWL